MKLPIRAWADTLISLGFSRRPKKAERVGRPKAKLRSFESLEERRVMTVLYLDLAVSNSWDTSTANWSTSSGGGSNVVWDPTATAVISGAGATVTVGSGVSAAGIHGLRKQSYRRRDRIDRRRDRRCRIGPERYDHVIADRQQRPDKNRRRTSDSSVLRHLFRANRNQRRHTQAGRCPLDLLQLDAQ
jgi:hypothetical protein